MKSNSWIILKDSQAVAETYNKRILKAKLKPGVEVIPAHEYLQRLNATIKGRTDHDHL